MQDPKQQKTQAQSVAQIASAQSKSIVSSPASDDKNIENLQAANKLKQIHAAAAHQPVDYEAQARKRRKKRAFALVQKLFLFVIAPTIAATVYYVFIARDQFMSTTSVSVKTEGTPSLGIDSIIGSFASSGTSKDALLVQEYILSRDMLKLLDEKEQFLKHYQNPNIDFLARLAPDATFEDAYEYYREMIGIKFDSESGVLTLEVKAFDPQSAQRFAQTLIKLSEQKVNAMSIHMQNDKIAFTKGVLDEAEKRLFAAQKAILSIQQEQGDFSPDHSAKSLMGLKSGLENALAQAQTQLNEARAIMAPTAPQVLALDSKVRSIKAQIRKENNRLIGSKEDGGMGKNIAEFELAMLEKELAQKEYQSATISLEAARLDALKQKSYLVEITSPSLVDEASYPKRWLKILTVFLVSLAAFGIFSLTVSAVKEHARI
jgi:capsular polysaccharide transport system permease protein